MKKMGLDLGYFQTKYCSDDKQGVFSSTIGSVYHQLFSLQNGDGIIFRLPDPFVVGDLAVTYADKEVHRTDRKWVGSTEYYRLFLAALSEVTALSEEVAVVTGLPISFFADRAQVKDTLLQAHTFQREGRESQTIIVPDVKVVPQPFGTLMDLCLNDHGQIINETLAMSHVGIIDIGGKTTNLLHSYKFRDIPHETMSINVGGWDIVDALKEELSAYQDLTLKDYEYEMLIRSRKLSYYGEKLDIGKAVDVACQSVLDTIQAAITTAWRSIATLETVIITGGGSYLIGEVLLHQFKQGILSKNPVYDKAAGFRKYANR